MTVQPVRIRLNKEDRRRQLIRIGLRLLVTRPIHEMAIDEVAAEAGISRGLLFHYFPTKRDFYIAVVRAAGNRLLEHAQAPESGDSREWVRGIVEGYVGFVQRRRENYVALVRAAAGGDDRVLEVFTEVRDILADRVLNAAGRRDPTPLVWLVVRGWLAMAEEMAIEATGEAASMATLVDLLVDNLDYSISRATDR